MKELNLYKIQNKLRNKFLKSFQFKSDALNFIEEKEQEYIRSKKYADILLQSGLITQDEYLLRTTQ